MTVDRHNEMTDELARLGTFDSYRRKVPQGIWFIRLAAAGFYLSLHDKIKCAFCEAEMELETFTRRNPWAVHREHCPLVREESTDNRTVENAGHTSSLAVISSLCAGDNHSKCESKRVGSGLPQSPTRSSTGSLVGSLSRGSASLSEPSQQSSGSATTPTGVEQPSEHSSTSNRFTASGVNSGEGQSLERPMPSVTGEQTFTANLYFPEGATVPQSARPAQKSSDTTPLPTHGNLTDGSNPSLPSPSSLGREEEDSRAPSCSSTTPPARGQEAEQQTTGGQGTGSSQVVTYEQLGIYTQRPKRPDLAVTASRITTFLLWPHKDSHPPEEMAEAGFYYTGHDDLVRCFFCKGGLKTWSQELRPWVQHAQWFPKCPFVLQAQGLEYVQAVQTLKDKVDVVSPEDVQEEIVRRNPRKTQVDDNFSIGKGLSQITPTKTSTGASNVLNVDTREDFTESPLNSQELSTRAGEVERLEAENQELTSSRFCKICLSEEATILFLPCGHLVACAQCAPALRTCAICRQRVSGTVRIKTE